MRRLLTAILFLALASGSAAAQQCVWGSFDASRINYPGGPLTGTEHSTLRGIITGAGGTIGAATPTLTAAYLAGVDVFYTSLLSTSTGVLSAAEQTALQAWVNAGGTLIVTGDIFPIPAYDSFTGVYGVTWTPLSGVGIGTTVGAHPIIAGVTNFSYNTQSTFTLGAGALVLGNDAGGQRFMAVFELGTGFPHGGGRLLVFGDHNMFTNSMIAQSQNTRLAQNFAGWACSGPVAVEPTTWGNLKSIYRAND
jgi:hypothetical protein